MYHMYFFIESFAKNLLFELNKSFAKEILEYKCKVHSIAYNLKTFVMTHSSNLDIFKTHLSSGYQIVRKRFILEN